MARLWRDQWKAQRHARSEGGEGVVGEVGVVKPFLNPSSIPEAKVKLLSNTLPLFDAVPFWLIPTSWLRVRFAP